MLKVPVLLLRAVSAAMLWAAMFSAALLSATLFPAAMASAQELIRYSNVATRSDPTTVEDSESLGISWPVEIELSTLARNPPQLVLTLPSGTSYRAERNDFEIRGQTALAWRGVLDGYPGWSATLTLDGDQLTGVVYSPEGAFEILTEPGGGHRLVQLLDTEPWCPGGVPHPRSLDPPSAQDRSITDRSTVGVDEAATSVLTVLALYTERALATRGGAAKIENEIQAAVDFFTTAARNNGVDGRGQLLLVQKAPPQLFDSDNLEQALERLRKDGEVAALRSELKADVVTLFTDRREAGGFGSGSCGLGYLMTRGDTAKSMSPYGYNAVNATCLREVLAHEIGHNLGLNHNPEDTEVNPSEAFQPWAYGHYGTGIATFRTIMSYGEQPRLTYYSTPSATYEGAPIGIAGERDNGRTLKDTLPIGAQFLSGQSAPVKPPAPTNVKVTAESPTRVAVSWSDPVADETGFQIESQIQGGSFAVADQVGADVEQTTIDGLVAGATYSFRVRTRRGSSLSTPSNTVVVTLPPALTAPEALVAVSVSDHEIRLEWLGGSEPSAVVELRSPAAEVLDFVIVSTAAGQFTLSELDPGSPYTFRLRMELDGQVAFSPQASAATAGAPGPCVAGPTTLCLLSNRFEVKARWRDQRQPGRNGLAEATPISTSDQSGLFQFFDPENIELVVKVLDGRGINQFFWDFYGALSDVEYWIVVRDTMTEATRTYHNPPGDLCGAADTRAFEDPIGGPLLRTASSGANRSQKLSVPDLSVEGLLSLPDRQGACVASDTVLCLQDSRFAIEVDWMNPRAVGDSGPGHTLPALSTSKTGFFWFFEPGNVELAVKLLDGRAFNERFWFFWGGLSDAEYSIRILDTMTGAEATYHNEPFSLCGGSDVNAL